MAEKQVKLNKYTWQLKDEKGRLTSGSIESSSLNVAKSQLRARGVVFTSIEEEKERRGGGVKNDDVVAFLRQFATMHNAGVSIVESMEMLKDSTDKKGLRKLYGDILQSLINAEPFSDALSHFPKYFDRLTISLIKAAEMGGILDKVLVRIATYQEDSRTLKKKTKSALMYPAVTVFVMIVVVIILMVKVIPVFSGLFKSFGGKLPELTQMVVNLSYFIKDNVFFIIIVPAIAISLTVISYKKYEKVRWFIDRITLKIPVIWTLILKSAVARFMATLATMQAAGVPIPDTLDVLSKISGNSLIDSAVSKSRDNVMVGGTVTDGLKGSVFPKLAIGMLEIGEKSGSIETMAAKTGDMYTEEVKEMVDRMSTLLEPFIMIVLGIVVGTLVIAMYMPMLDMGSVILKGTGS